VSLVNQVEAVIYVGDLKCCGSGGSAPQEKQATGFRILVVDLYTRGQDIGKKPTNGCIRIARKHDHYHPTIFSPELVQIA
jgi:hypothetical protein